MLGFVVPAPPRLFPVTTAALAATAPALLAYNVSPSPTFLNQALALAGWGLFLLVTPAPAWRQARAASPLLAALALVGVGVLLSWGPGLLPSSLALSALAMLAATAALLLAGTAARSNADGPRPDLITAFALGWLLAGVLSAGIALIQVFAPTLADGSWIARSGTPGRAVGNLRQPNHLSSLLVWATIALVMLHDRQRLRTLTAWILLPLLVLAVVLSASRTGLLSVLVLAVWGLLDRRLERGTRWLLLAAPLLYAVAWGGMAAWAQTGAHAFAGEARLHASDISSSRFGIWANTLALIRAQPWTGVGFGEFNAAWTLSAFPGRPTAFFDHTHNLPLQLLVELGLPLGGLVLALLLWALAAPARRWARSDTDARGAWMMVLMAALHSLLEYPLWYAYFLLPTAWAWGYALGHGGPAPAGAAPPAAGRRRWVPLLLIVGALASVFDYQRVTVIFEPGPQTAPLAQRVADGRRSLLFSHHADYAAATTGLAPADDLAVYGGALHYLLDTRLMMAWARSLEAAGHHEEALTVAARLREFGHPASKSMFEGCAAAAAAGTFPCAAPTAEIGWRQLLLMGR